VSNGPENISFSIVQPSLRSESTSVSMFSLPDARPKVSQKRTVSASSGSGLEISPEAGTKNCSCSPTRYVNSRPPATVKTTLTDPLTTEILMLPLRRTCTLKMVPKGWIRTLPASTTISPCSFAWSNKAVPNVSTNVSGRVRSVLALIYSSPPCNSRNLVDSRLRLSVPSLLARTLSPEYATPEDVPTVASTQLSAWALRHIFPPVPSVL
jgi:hypothetical protein